MLENEYHSLQRRKKQEITIVYIGTAAVFLMYLTWGTGIGLADGAAAIFQYFFYHTFTGAGGQTTADKVVVLLRLPRLCMAVAAGIGLSAAGMMMQAVTRNFLVSPFTLGVSSAAAFGASVCIVFGSATVFFNEFMIIGSAFGCAMLGMLLIFLITRKIGITANSIILVGIALNYFFAALTASLQFFAAENKLSAVVQWTFGTFNRANWDGVIIVSAVVVVCCIIASIFTLQWNIMASGDDELVRSLGFEPGRLRSMSLIIAVLMTATIISFTGVIGFIGLIAPHISRFIIGNDHRFLFPMTGAVGALLLLLSDAVGFFILYPVIVPVGIVVSFLGVPVFVHLILKNKGGTLG